MTLHIRRATPFDAKAMADLLNEIIRIGGTTALTHPLAKQELLDWLSLQDTRSLSHIATDDLETCLGFQWVGPRQDLPHDTCEIATFVKSGQTGLGIGSRLFDATRLAAKSLGYRWIQADIRSDNISGLTYYQSRGFEDIGHKTGVTLGDGRMVSKVLKRFDLR